METFSRLAQRRPLLGYFLLAYGISWVLIFAIVGVSGLRGGELSTGRGLLVWLAMIAGPSVAALVMAWLVSGRQGLRELWSGMTRWRVGARWYATLLISPVVGSLIVLALASYSRDFSPLVVTDPNVMALIPLFVAIVIGATLEEVGWTGYATPRLRMLYGLLTTALLLGALHGAWHLMADVSGRGDAGVTYIPKFIIFWIVGLIALRVLIVWVYENTQSLLLGQLIHASYTAPLVLLTPQSASPGQILFLWTAFTVTFGIVVLTIVFALRGVTLQQSVVEREGVPVV